MTQMIGFDIALKMYYGSLDLRSSTFYSGVAPQLGLESQHVFEIRPYFFDSLSKSRKEAIKGAADVRYVREMVLANEGPREMLSELDRLMREYEKQYNR